ncbi:MAG: hypothetical protein AB7X49_20610 [Geminicoccaceae bacterium]
MCGTLEDWREATVSGFRAMGASRYQDAARHWLDAEETLAEQRSGPLAAAALSNAGVAHALLSRLGEAEAALADAEGRWQQVAREIAGADMPLRGASSAFHGRLAERNLAAFAEAERHRLLERCETALTIACLNRLIAGAPSRASEASMARLGSRLARLLGTLAPEVRLLAPHAAHGPALPDSPYAEIADLAMLANARRNGAPDLAASLAMAVPLTALIRPGLAQGVTRTRRFEGETRLRGSD